MTKLPRIAWFSPISGETASAYLTELLLPEMSKHFDIEIFHDSFEKHPSMPAHHYLAAAELHNKNPYDLFFYQFEDRKELNFVRSHLGLIPGVVLFHDFLVTQDGPEPILNSPWEETVKHFNDLDRAWPERGTEFKRERPYAIREAGYALLAGFSCPRLHKEYESVSKRIPTVASAINGVRSFYLPFPAREKVPAQSDNSINLAFCGSPRIEHRAHKLLQAIAEYNQGSASPLSFKWLVNADELTQAQALCQEFAVQSVSFVVGRSPSAWQEVVRTCNVAIHPLFSVFGHTGPYLPISLTQGKVCLVTNFGATEYLPDNLVMKIRPGESEVREMKAVFSKLDSAFIKQVGELSAVYGCEEFNVKKVTAELAAVFESVINPAHTVQSRWRELSDMARDEIVKESRSLMDTEIWSAICRTSFSELKFSRE